jgi:hypothetical protein
VESLAKFLMLMGALILFIGAGLYLAARFIPNIEKLPGTIRIESGNLICIFPLAASLVISIVLTVLINTIIRLTGGK